MGAEGDLQGGGDFQRIRGERERRLVISSVRSYRRGFGCDFEGTLNLLVRLPDAENAGDGLRRYQFRSPNSDTSAGTSSIRTTAASKRMPKPRPVANTLMSVSGPDVIPLVSVAVVNVTDDSWPGSIRYTRSPGGATPGLW